MISTQLIGTQKLVLFVDHLGIERNSRQIIESILKERNLEYAYDSADSEIAGKTIVLEAISKLALNHNEREILIKIHKLRTNEDVTQIFCWASSSNVESKIMIPFLIHMSDIVVTIKSEHHLSILTKTKSGGVRLKEYIHNLGSGRLDIREVEKMDDAHQQQRQEEGRVDNADAGTFKIGQFTPEELEAKRNLTLPFEKIRPSSNAEEKKPEEAKIIYLPDNADDFDEEDDPDNDLQF